MMKTPTQRSILRAGLAITLAGLCSATAAQPQADRDDAALAYAQCMRDNGYTEFPDASPTGDVRFRITPETAPRFQAAADACRELAPEGLRNDDITPDELEALVRLSACVRENGIPEFPDPGPKGNFDLQGTGIGPGDTRLEAAMDMCRDEAGFRQGFRIMIGG
jgi:hypothetical protein